MTSLCGPQRRACCGCLAYVCWGSLLASALLVAGIVLQLIKGDAAKDATQQLLAFAQSGEEGFSKLVSVWASTFIVSVGVAAGLLAATLVVASLRLDQKIRKAGSCGAGGSCGHGSAGQPVHLVHACIETNGLLSPLGFQAPGQSGPTG